MGDWRFVTPNCVPPIGLAIELRDSPADTKPRQSCGHTIQKFIALYGYPTFQWRPLDRACACGQ